MTSICKGHLIGKQPHIDIRSRKNSHRTDTPRRKNTLGKGIPLKAQTKPIRGHVYYYFNNLHKKGQLQGPLQRTADTTSKPKVSPYPVEGVLFVSMCCITTYMTACICFIIELSTKTIQRIPTERKGERLTTTQTEGQSDTPTTETQDQGTCQGQTQIPQMETPPLPRQEHTHILNHPRGDTDKIGRRLLLSFYLDVIRRKIY